MRRVAIVGAALSDTGRVDDKTVHDLHYQGVTRALADAGLTKDDIGGFMSCGLGTMAPVEVTDYLGIRPDWIDSAVDGAQVQDSCRLNVGHGDGVHADAHPAGGCRPHAEPRPGHDDT